MRKHTRSALTALTVLASVVTLAACGSSSSSSSSGASSGSSGSSSSGKSGTSGSSGNSGGKGGTITLLMGTPPQSMDPQFDYTTQGSEMNWNTYLGLTTYAHASGLAGSKLIPGLATALPTISKDGLTYTAQLRSGLKFSDGSPVVASDFTRGVERALKIPWGGSGQFITPIIKGAAAFAAGKASTISGIVADDKTGQITIHLTQPYGPFVNVLAFPAMGFVPAKTALSKLSNNPPPGVGPYMYSNIQPNVGYTAVPNPHWTSGEVPGVPSAKVTVNVKFSSNVSSNALSVLNGSGDVFDWADTIPGSLLPQINSQAKDRFKMVSPGGSTYYIFMNSQVPPFNNQLAREAVVTGLNEGAFNRLGGGTLQPGCFFLPPSIPGHPSGSCPYGAPGAGDMAKAQALVKQSGQAGASVTVWSETRTPRQQWMTYYTQYLNQLGFHATQKVLADANYFTTIGERKLHPQTGFADWNQDFPNPIDFYGVLLYGPAIQPTNNENFGETNDPYINAQVKSLQNVPTTQIDSVTAKWQAVDEYTAKKAYVAVFGYQTFPEFTSSKVNFSSIVFQPVYGYDWTSFSLK